MSDAINGLYQQVLGRNADPDGLAHFQAELDAGESLDQIRGEIAYGSEASGDIDDIAEEVEGRGATADEYATYEYALSVGGVWTLSGVRWAMAHSDAATSAINGIYEQMLGYGSDDSGLLAAYENNLGNAGWTLGTVRSDLAHRSDAQSGIQSIYQSVLGRSASSGEVSAWEDNFAAGYSLSNLRTIAAQGSEATSDINSYFEQSAGRAATGDEIASYESYLAGNVMTMDGARYAIAFSDATTAAINNIYQTMLGHGSNDPGLLGAYQYNMYASNWSLSNVTWDLAHRPEATAAIQSIYQQGLGRAASADEVSTWQYNLSGGNSIYNVSSIVFHSDQEAAAINAIYQQILGRDAGADGIAFQENQGLAQGLSLAQIRLNVATSSESQANIAAAFQNELGRPAQAGDIAWWESALFDGRATLATMRSGLASSPEAQNAINAVYEDVLGRPSDPVGLAGFEGVLASGQSLANVRQDIANTSLATNVVDEAFSDELGRSASAGDEAAWQAAFGNDSQTVASMRSYLASTPEAQGDIAYVFTNEYGRQAQSYDYAYWENALATGQTTLQGMRNAISQSQEAVSIINGYYQLLLGRQANAGDLNWAETQLSQGVSDSSLEEAIAQVGASETGFDAAYYLANNPDVAAAGVDPYIHYCTSGWHEGRNPNAYFNTAYYLQQNPDVAAAGVNPLLHYTVNGWHEGRNPSAQFDTNAYLAANPDVAANWGNPLTHYLDAGIHEGRAIYAAPTNQVLVSQQAQIDTFYSNALGRSPTFAEVGSIEVAVDYNGSSLGSQFAAIEAPVINAFYEQHFGVAATAGALTNIEAAVAAGQSLASIEQALLGNPTSITDITADANAFYQRIFGENAPAAAVQNFQTALTNGLTIQQAENDFLPGLVYSDTENNIIGTLYQEVTGQQADNTTISNAEHSIAGGEYLADVRYDIAHSDAADISINETFLDALGRSASDTEIAIWEDDLSGTGTSTSMRLDLAQQYAAGQIDKAYHQVLDRAASPDELAFWENQLATGQQTQGDVRWSIAHSSEVSSAIEAAAVEQEGLALDPPNLSEIESALAAGATLDSIEAGFNVTVTQAVIYDTHGDVVSSTLVYDPYLTARNAATGFYSTVFGRPPTLDEAAGVEAAFSANIAPNTPLTVTDQKGNILGQATADKLLTQLPVFTTLNDGATPLVSWPGGTPLVDGAQVAAFLLGIEGRAGRLDQKTLSIYTDVANWMDQVGQQLLQLATTMAQAEVIDGNADRRAIDNEIVKLAVAVAAVPASLRAQVAASSGFTERLNLTGHQADLSLVIDPLTGEWTYKVHDLDNTDWFGVVVQAVTLVATAVLVVATAGGATPLLALEASTLTAVEAVAVLGNVALAGESFANGDVLSGLLSLAAAVGAGLVPAGPSQTALVSFSGSAQTGQLLLAARGIIGGISSAVQAGESGNALGLVSSVLSVAASAASGEVAIEGNTASAALKDVGYFLTGVSTATGIADAYNRGDIQGGLMASLNGLLTAYSIATQLSSQRSVSEQATPSNDAFWKGTYPVATAPAESLITRILVFFGIVDAPLVAVVGGAAALGAFQPPTDRRFSLFPVSDSPGAIAVVDWQTRQVSITLPDPTGGEPLTVGYRLQSEDSGLEVIVGSNGKVIGRLVPDTSTLGAINVQLQSGGPAPPSHVGTGYEIRSDEEAHFISDLLSRGANSLEISAALDMFRSGQFSVSDTTMMKIDPARTFMGSAQYSNPTELAAMKQQLQAWGVSITERPGVMAYQPSPSSGVPGRLVIDPDASYSAWLHEYQHVVDDRNAGWSGMRVLQNIPETIRREQVAYQVEIDFLTSKGFSDAAKQLRANFEALRIELLGIAQ